MKLLVVLLAVVAVAVAEELEQSSEHKKRGVAKSPSINSLSSNGHQKPEQLTYAGFQQQSATQTPLYPLAPPSYSADPQQPVTHQPMFSFLPSQPQMLPLSFFTPQYSMPKYQIIAMKSVNGQTHLTLVPQNSYYTPQQTFNPSQSFLQSLQQPLLSNHLNPTQQNQQNSQNQQTSTTYHPASSQSSFSSQISQGQSTQTPNTPNFLSSQQFYNPSNLQFGHNPLLAQPSTMFIFSQPAPQLYSPNNYASPQNLLYSQAGQQLLNYYHANPQAKNQLLYGNNHGYQQQQQQQSHVNSYQNPITPTEYEKNIPGPVQPSLTSQKNDDLNTNEFVSQTDTQFRPIPSYGSRSQTAYKN